MYKCVRPGSGFTDTTLMKGYDLKTQSDIIPLKKTDGSRTVLISVNPVVGR